MKILIVGGNSSEILKAVRAAGQKTAAECYIEALSIYVPNAHFSVSMPYAREMESLDFQLCDYDCIALTGSGVSWSSSDAEAKPYLAHLEELFALDKPVIGSCWGMQTVAQLFGGHSEPNTKGTEVGIAHDIELNELGRSHYIFDGLPDSFSSPCIHRDHVTRMPDGFAVLASNEVSPVQSIASTDADIDFVGFQFHPEFTIQYVKKLVERKGDYSKSTQILGGFPDSTPIEVSDKALRTRVFGNWLRYVQSKKAAMEVAA